MNNNYSISKVMNNSDLRRIIWSYLRKLPKITCMYCDSVCVWDNKVKEYYEVPFFYYNISYHSENTLYKKNVYCKDCSHLHVSPECKII